MATVTRLKQFRRTKLGSLGYLMKIDSHSGGRLVCAGDVNAICVRDPGDAEWRHINTKAVLPAGTTVDLNAEQNGGFDIKIAPTDANYIVFITNNAIYKSTNGGLTAVECNSAPLRSPSNYNLSTNPDWLKQAQGKLAIDPFDKNHWLIATNTNGLFETIDGGTTITAVRGTGFTAPGGSGTRPGVTGILFDASSGVNANGRCQRAVAFSYANGYFQRTVDTGNWSAIAGLTMTATTMVNDAAFDSTGRLYVVTCPYPMDNGATNKLQRAASGGSFSVLGTHSNIYSVTVNPSNDNHIVCFGLYGSSFESTDAWATNTALASNLGSWTATDCPVLDNPPYDFTLATVKFSKAESNVLIAAQGIGCWKTTRTTAQIGANWAWTSYTAGIEMLVCNNITALPSGRVMMSVWDKVAVTLRTADGSFNPEAYLTDYLDSSLAQSITDCHSITRQADNANRLGVAVCRYLSGPPRLSGVSTDGGASYVKFANRPSLSANLGGFGYEGGHVMPFDTTGAMWFPVVGIPVRTTDVTAGTITWTGMTFPGVNNQDSTGVGVIDFAGSGGFWNSRSLRKSIACADLVNPSKFYAFHFNAGHYRSTDKGATWSRMNATPVQAGASFNTKMFSVPGKEDHLLWCYGGSIPEGSGNQLWRSTDGGATWAVPGTDTLKEVKAMGCGKARNGSAYPAVMMVGYVNNVFGVWVSYDEFATWEKWNDDIPLGLMTTIDCIAGSLTNFGEWHLGTSGNGAVHTFGAEVGETHYLQIKAA